MSTGIYVIESKNYAGYIYGSEKSDKWQQFLRNKKYDIINPIKQNNYHINFLGNNLKKDYSYFKSYIVYGDNSTLKVNYKNPYVKVIKNENLIEELIYDIHNSKICITNEEIDKLYIDLNYFRKHSR